ncbi:NnrS family protein [Ectopseudomonas mendocina]|uniref:NnrS family protein n=1 Tax=Ectopseudomonas mendocina TaxID=300 RepID=A0ABZ2RIQ8_ECTME
MQISDKRKAMAIPAVLRLSFRPFFLLGALLALVAVPVWVLELSGVAALTAPAGGWLAWHRHELVFGFAGAIIAGFLLTAAQTWTGQHSVSGWPLAGLVLLWLLARLAWWVDEISLLVLNALFLLAVACVLGRMLWRARQVRNYPTVFLLLLLCASDVLTLLGVQAGNEAWQRQGVLAAVWLVSGMMSLIGGRVIPFFTQRGLGRTHQVTAWPWLDWFLLIGSVLIAALTALGLMHDAHWSAGVLFALLGVGHAVRLVRWFDAGFLRVPLLWSLHIAYAWLVVACAGLAAWNFGAQIAPSQALHALTVGAMGGLILAMLARVSLGHTGRPLQLPTAFSLAFVLLNLAAMARVFGVSLDYSTALWLAAVGWSLAFLQFVLCYGPMLCKTRVDGHPG